MPAAAKVREWRLAIGMTDDKSASPLTLREKHSAALREMWSGQLLLAAAGVETIDAIGAWVDSLDGRVNPFRVSLPAGVTGQAAAFAAALAAVPALGSDRIKLTPSPTSGTILAGTLLTVGTITSDPFQLFEVVEDATVGATVTLRVAPRVRRVFDIGATVAMGSVEARLRLSSDMQDGQRDPITGSFTLAVVEAH